MICPKCGFDPESPIGENIKEFIEGKDNQININENGLRMISHNQMCHLRPFEAAHAALDVNTKKGLIKWFRLK